MTYAHSEFTSQYRSASAGFDQSIPFYSRQFTGTTNTELAARPTRTLRITRLPKSLVKLAWFAGGYSVSVLSFGGLVNGVHLTLSLL